MIHPADHPAEAAGLMGYEVVEDNAIEGMCCDCAEGGPCCDYSENENCPSRKEDGSCWKPYTEKEAPMEKMDKPRICEVLGVEQFERICEAVHNGWWDEKKRQGVTGHPDMIPYDELAEDVKEYDRVTVRRVLDALGIRYESKPRFSQEEVADARVLVRALLADGFERDNDGDIFATSSVTCRTLLDSRMFPSLRPGQSVALEDIIKEATP